MLARRDAAIARLANERGQLAAHALTAEQRERRRVAELLHDESVQTLALAQQELRDYHRTGRDAAFERARAAIAEAIAQLRGEIFELHPYVLDHAGLSAALRAIADRCAERMTRRSPSRWIPQRADTTTSSSSCWPASCSPTPPSTAAPRASS